MVKHIVETQVLLTVIVVINGVLFFVPSLLLILICELS